MPPPKKKRAEKVVEVVEEEGPTVIPKDQCKLTAKQLDEDITRVLTATNPLAAQGLVSYNYAARAFKSVPAAPDADLVFHFRQISTTMHNQSEQAAEQREYEKNFRTMVEDRRRERLIAAQEEGKELSTQELEEDDTQRNQFNFTERAAQTYKNTTKTRVVSTLPPESTNDQGSMSQWALYDAYVVEYERLLYQMSMEKAAKKKGVVEEQAKAPGSDDPMHTPEMAARLSVLERMVNQVRVFKGRWGRVRGGVFGGAFF